MKHHVFHPEAAEEYVEAARYYRDVEPSLGVRFHNEVERSIRAVRLQPDRFLQFYPPARRALVHRFPYSVVFLEQSDRIWIVAVMHGARRPGYWKSRVG